jgi:hypothetical protein
MNNTEKTKKTSKIDVVFLFEEDKDGHVVTISAYNIPRNKIIKNDISYKSLLSDEIWKRLTKRVENNPRLKSILVPFDREMKKEGK